MEKQYVKSERAHFMCPNMHFAILIEINSTYSKRKVMDSLALMSKAHPFLRSLIQYDVGSTDLFYCISDENQINTYEKESEETIWEDYKEIGKKEWNVFKNGLLKVFLYPSTEGFKALFTAHHLLGDGRCLLDLVCEFANVYVDGVEPIYVEENLIKGLADLPSKSDLSGISRLLVKNMNKKWKRENKKVTYEEYAGFAEQFAKNNPVGVESYLFDESKVNSMKKLCKDNNISINDLLMAALYVEANTNKIIIAADIRNKLNCYNPGALGNYASAMGITCKDTGKDVIKKAKKVHNQVAANIQNNRKLMLVLSCYLNMDAGLIDAAAIAALGNFESKAAGFVGGSMFGYTKRDSISITNLGAISNRNIKDAIFIPPASPAAIQTTGVLTVNNNMQLCSSYYEKAISKEYIKTQLERMDQLIKTNVPAK